MKVISTFYTFAELWAPWSHGSYFSYHFFAQILGQFLGASQVAQMVKNLPAVQETWGFIPWVADLVIGISYTFQ